MKKILIVCVIAVSALWGEGSVHAALVTFKADPSVGTDSPFAVEVNLTSPTSVNAITATFKLSPGLTITDFSDGNSVVKIWIERLYKSAENEWTASGIIPGGYFGKEGKLLTLYIEGDTEGPGSVSMVSTSEAYGNTGEAPREKIDSVPATFTLVTGKINPAPDFSTDTESPESFLPVIGKIPREDGEVWAVTFGTQDKGSGIARYEVAESSGQSTDATYADLSWLTTESPYVLTDQSRRSWVYVKAVDKNGLTIIQSLAPSSSWFKGIGQYILIALALVAGLYVLFKIISRRR